MKPLLPFTSPTYLRRLARELNALSDGFYFEGQRYNRASVSSTMGIRNGAVSYMFKISRPGDEANHTISRGLSGSGEYAFSDAYGRSVVASRRAVK